jgi:hypothetical protein
MYSYTAWRLSLLARRLLEVVRRRVHVRAASTCSPASNFFWPASNPASKSASALASVGAAAYTATGGANREAAARHAAKLRARVERNMGSGGTR